MTTEDIVRALAASRQPTSDLLCTLCGVDVVFNTPTKHLDSCPWLMAREWVDSVEAGWEERERLGLSAKPDYSGLSGRRVGSEKDPYP